MGSTRRNTVFQMSKTNKPGSKAAVSPVRGSEVASTPTHRGQGYTPVPSQQSPTAFSPMNYRRTEASYPTATHSADHPQFLSPQSGPGIAIPRGNENKSKSDSFRHSPHQKIQQTPAAAPYTSQIHRTLSPSREDGIRKGGESKSGHDRTRATFADAKSSRRLSFQEEKDNLEILQEEDPPSKVQYPQGVRVPRRHLVHPKDEAVQTDPIRKNVATEARSYRKPSSPQRGSSRITTDSKKAQKRMPVQESEVGHSGSTNIDPKNLHRSMNMESSLRVSVLKDLNSGHRVSLRQDPESVRSQTAHPKARSSPKIIISEVESNMRSSVRGDNEPGRRVTISPGDPSVQSIYHVRAASESPQKPFMSAAVEPVHKQTAARPRENVFKYPGPTPKCPAQAVELELTPRPLPPRSLPKYEPDSSWWHLLNPEEIPQSRPVTPDFELTAPPSPDILSYFYEMDSWPCSDDLMFQREKACLSPPAAAIPSTLLPKESPSWAPLREVPQASKSTSKQSIQRFSAFFLGM